MQPINNTTVNTTCPYCGVGCGVAISPANKNGMAVSGDSDHPANRGNLCLKGKTLGETVTSEGRLLYPTAYGERCSWDNALTLIAGKFKEVTDNHGPEAIAFYVSGQLLTEDYYAVNKFVKGYLGTANIDTNSRLCMASSVAGHKRAFGTDTVPGCYEDLELAELVVLVGSNLAWCHPVLYNRLDTARQNNPNLQVINIDPRATATAELSDTHLQIRPDSDTALFNGLLRWLAMHNYADHDFIQNATNGLTESLATVGAMDIKTVADCTGLSEEQVHRFYRRFADCKKVVTVYSQGVNQSVGGTDKVNSIINCHLYTGRIGKPGAGPFSVTGQPNAMGGRETGGLANTLTCHMELDNPDHRQLVQSYWQSPTIADKPGLTAVDLFNAVHEGRIKALWIMATNPLVSMPDTDFVTQALRNCEFVIQSDVVVNNDTAEYAHVRLPAQAWGEKDGTVTNSERCISRQRRFLTPPGETRADWQAIAGVAKKLGHSDAFGYESVHEIFAEYATLSGLENAGRRDFDISAFHNIEHTAYNSLKPFYWPAVRQVSETPIRFFSDGKFFTGDGRARFVPIQPIAPYPSAEKTLLLNTGRTRDQWHTMTRTGTAHTLSNHTAEPYIQIHPVDAEERGLSTADLALVKNNNGNCIVRAIVTDSIAQGAAFIPMHWCKPFSSKATVNVLTDRVTDPVSKQPALKRALVTVEKLKFAHYGFIVTRHQLDTTPFDYFAKAKCKDGWRYEFAIHDQIQLKTSAQGLIQRFGSEVIELTSNNGRYCHFSFTGETLHTAMVIDTQPVSAARNWLSDQLSQTHTPENRHQLLAAIKPCDQQDTGDLICDCMSVGSKEIEASIRQRGCNTVYDVGRVTGAGSNCGSCRSEITAMLKRFTLQQTA